MQISPLLTSPLPSTQTQPPPTHMEPNNQPTRTIMTRSQCGVFKPNPKYNISTSTTITISPLPKSHKQALANPNRNMAMCRHLILVSTNKAQWQKPKVVALVSEYSACLKTQLRSQIIFQSFSKLNQNLFLKISFPELNSNSFLKSTSRSSFPLLAKLP